MIRCFVSVNGDIDPDPVMVFDGTFYEVPVSPSVLLDPRSHDVY